MLTTIAIESLKRRKSTALLTLVSIVISVSLLLSVDIIRTQVKSSFTRTVSGVDVIVGAPNGQLNLLLSSVFNLSAPTKGISKKSVLSLQEDPRVSWLIPISLGDTHKGFRVIGTTNAYFQHFKYGDKQPLSFASGGLFSDAGSTVIGADIAESLGYSVADNIVISHGLGNVSFRQHDAYPFTVVGVLNKTGTPVDKAVYITLSGLEQAHSHSASSSITKPLTIKKPPVIKKSSALAKPHSSGQHGAEVHEAEHSEEHASGRDEKDHKEHHEEHYENYDIDSIRTSSVSAVMLGLENRVTALQLQYQINQRSDEPLLAILPGMALAELWQIMGNVEALLLLLSTLIVVSSLFGLATMLLATMRERYREIAVLRTIGASPATLLILVQIEALLIALAGCCISILLVLGLLHGIKPWLSSEYGVFLGNVLLTKSSAIIVLLVVVSTYLVSFFPAHAAYRRGLHRDLNDS
ncbi:ABC transporter permease [Alteromonas hispanica]|uniref:FtsX-like permease family protein n=1 Tax=Alteromonas hispanica TaxID=315421 RepID=A0A6L9MSK4_9ALTE|nr:ABC transporter permease [Alteromonas hispanica]NDW21142.1 FtsX-like permease family protein [Alteromonas hispanica]